MHFLLLLLLSLTPLPLHRHTTCTHDVRSKPHCNKKERAIHTRSLFGLRVISQTNLALFLQFFPLLLLLRILLSTLSFSKTLSPLLLLLVPP